MKQQFSITVRGKRATYAFTFTGDPAHLEGWRADGLEVDQIVNTVPLWAQRLGLTRPWCFVQDVWQWLRVW